LRKIEKKQFFFSKFPKTKSFQDIIQSLRPECATCDEPRLLEMLSNIKKYFDLRAEIENCRTTKVDRKNHRTILQIMYEQIMETKIIVGLTKEVYSLDFLQID